jgi:hypothetical protein
MTANRSEVYAVGDCIRSDPRQFLQRQPFDRLFGLGGAFILTFAPSLS